MDKKGIILARVSTEMQSLESQLDKLFEEAKRCGYDSDMITVISGKESGVKLDIEERETIQKLKEHIDTGQYDIVFIWEVSRLARRPKVLYEVREYLIEHHVNLHCMTPQFTMLKEDGTIDPTASIVFALFGTMAEEEARLTKARMRRGVNKKKELGYHAGGPIMYGYDTLKTESGYQYIIDEAQATVVKRIFTDYVNGKSMRMLTRDLQEEGHFKGVKYLTAVQEVYNILHRDCYCGRKKGMPAIISESLYDKSVEMRKHNELKVSRTSNMSLCKGILRDSDSGLLLSSNTAANMYYSKRCKGVSVSMHIMDPIIWEYSVELHKEYNKMDVEQILNGLIRRRQMNERKMKTLYEKENELEEKKDKIEERLIMGKLSEKKADELEEQINNEIKDIRERAREIMDDNMNIETEGNRIYSTRDVNINYEELNKEQRYDVVHAVIDKVMLKRIERAILEINIYNKIDDKVKTIEVNTFKRKK